VQVRTSTIKTLCESEAESPHDLRFRTIPRPSPVEQVETPDSLGASGPADALPALEPPSGLRAEVAGAARFGDATVTHGPSGARDKVAQNSVPACENMFRTLGSFFQCLSHHLFLAVHVISTPQ
jgi:hypothetical protein